MSPTATARAETHRRRIELPSEWWWIIAVALAVAIVFAAMPVLRGGHFVPHVRFVNQSAYDMEVDAARSPSDGWMPVITAINRHASVADEVFDLGDRWVFRFSTPDRSAEIAMTRNELEEAHWTVTVPAEFVDNLRANNAIPSPQVDVG